ncbi:MAG TPA: DUF2147 domain-containing protein [Flavipsychrobacter sp.]|nr:DUF2147 domain-containing protein [Flavipsychrobacter sp.]
MKKTMKFLSLVALLVSALFVPAKAQSGADTILGKWTNEDKTRVIEFIKSGSVYNAVIRKAPDQSVVGKNQLANLSYRDGNYNGNVLLPKKGKSYPCTLRMKDDGTMEMTAKAGFMTKSQVWTKVK